MLTCTNLHVGRSPCVHPFFNPGERGRHDKEGTDMMCRKKSLKSAAFLILATFVIFLMSSCATMGQKVYHDFIMKGSIIETSDSEVYLCIGSKDGASVGQELDVYKIVKTPSKVTPFKRAH